MSYWENKVVMITGGTSGIGKEMSKLLLSKGAKLIIAGRNDDEIEKLKNNMRDYLDKILFHQVDISFESSCKKLIDHAIERFGRIDVLINNAGVGLNNPIEDIQDEDIRKVFDINFFGSFYMIKHVLPVMKEKGYCLIVNICSLGVKRPVPYTGGYTASKAALDCISKVAKFEAFRYNVKIINVYPGSIATDFRKNALGRGYSENDKRLSRLSPHEAAIRIIKGIEKGKEEVYTSNADKFLAIFTRLFPRFSDYIIEKVFK